MSFIPLFAPVFRSTPQNLNLIRDDLLGKKRKRDQCDPSLSLEPPLDGEITYSTPDFTGTGLGSAQIAQYKVAGQPPNEDLPGIDFPHKASTPARNSPANGSKADVTASGVKRPSHSSKRSRHVGQFTGLRRQHLAVLTAVLHRCMLEGDCVRAGRALGMLLRADLGGHSFDPRTGGIWGFGAEILMYRDSQLATKQTQEQNEQLEEPVEAISLTDRWTGHRKGSLFTSDGFKKAKDYYERLVLQYPYRKAAPTSVSSVDFYPAMFGLWIYTVQEEGKRVYNAAREGNGGELHQEQEQDIRADIRKQALEQISEINARLDELLVSPPYSDHATLWRLRGMVAVWEADLVRSVEYPHREMFLAAKSKARQALGAVSRLEQGSVSQFPNLNDL